ncbi:Uncharacterized protein HZ326_30686, partial [Fusarium oxysporum f. sp. albedinis]
MAFLGTRTTDRAPPSLGSRSLQRPSSAASWGAPQEVGN